MFMLGDRFLSSASTGKSCALAMRVPNPSPVLDKNPAPMGPEISSSTGPEVYRKHLRVFQSPVLYWINFSLRYVPYSFLNLVLGLYIFSFFPCLSLSLSLSVIFWISGLFYSVAGQGNCKVKGRATTTTPIPFSSCRSLGSLARVPRRLLVESLRSCPRCAAHSGSR